MISRAEYMNAPKLRDGRYCGWLGHLAHRAYYGQFVTPGIIAIVRRAIGEEVLKASRDAHFNDIALERWDRIGIPAATISAIKAAGDGYSLSLHACLFKEAARQWLESEGWQEWPCLRAWKHSDSEPIMSLARGRSRQEAFANAEATNQGCVILELFEPEEVQGDASATE